jgi:uncharacterized protein
MNQTKEFEWDPKKAAANLLKHKVPFIKAAHVFQDPLRLERPDDSDDSDDDRWIVLGSVENRVLLVVFTLRDSRIRLISARKANRDEQEAYWSGHIPT